MLRVLDITNCSALTQTIDLSGCPAIEDVRAAGTKITGVSLASGTRIRSLVLPASITGLTLRNQAQISYSGTSDDGLQVAGLIFSSSSLKTARLSIRSYSHRIFSHKQILLPMSGCLAFPAHRAIFRCSRNYPNFEASMQISISWTTQLLKAAIRLLLHCPKPTSRQPNRCIQTSKFQSR